MRFHARRTLLGSGLSLLGGCGFHPLLAPGRGSSQAIVDQLRSIYVPVIPERSGQLFREALQARLNGSSVAATKKYELDAGLTVDIEGLAIERDSSTTRFRVIASTSWTLLDLTTGRAIATTGYARLLDGYDNINQQYISTAYESDAAARRVANNLADRVVQQLAVYFNPVSTVSR